MHMILAQRKTTLVMAALSVVLTIVVCISVGRSLTGESVEVLHSGRFADFWRSYTVSKFLAEGKASAVYDPAQFVAALGPEAQNSTIGFYGWVYSPVYFFVAAWLAWLPYKWSFVCWALFQLGIFVWAGKRFLWDSIIGFLAVLSPVFLLSLSWGQNGVFVAGLYIAAFRFLKSNECLAGIIFGCCIIKPQLGVLIPVILLLGRHYKVLGWAALTVVVLVILSALAYGVEPWRMYLLSVTNKASVTGDMPLSDLISASVALHMPTVYASGRALGAPPLWAAFLQLMAAGYAIFYLYLHRRDLQSPQYAMLQCALLTLLSFPYFGNYDYVFSATSCIGLLAMAKDQVRKNMLLLVAVWMIYWANVFQSLMALEYRIIVAPLIILLTHRIFLYCRFAVPQREEPQPLDVSCP